MTYVYFVVKSFAQNKHTKNEVTGLTYPLTPRFSLEKYKRLLKACKITKRTIGISYNNIKKLFYCTLFNFVFLNILISKLKF